MAKFIKGAASAAKSLRPSEVKKDPAKAAGTIVGAGVAAAGHPYVAIAAAKATEKIIGRAAPGIRSRIKEFKTQGHTPETPQP